MIVIFLGQIAAGEGLFLFFFFFFLGGRVWSCLGREVSFLDLLGVFFFFFFLGGGNTGDWMSASWIFLVDFFDRYFDGLWKGNQKAQCFVQKSDFVDLLTYIHRRVTPL